MINYIEEMQLNELYHHGIQGQKWGVRRFQNEDGTLTEAGKKRIAKYNKKVNSMYDHSNKWTNRKIKKLDDKGKTAKADVMRELVRQNESSRRKLIKKSKDTILNKNNEFRDAFFGGQRWMKNNSAKMERFVTRFSEYQTQRAMRWMSNFTLNSTLARMSVSDGVDYLKRKANDSQKSRINLRINMY